MIARNGSVVGDREAAVAEQLQRLAPALDGEPDPGFQAATRARLVAMAAVRSPAPEPVSPVRRLLAVRSSDTVPARWRTRLTAGLAGAALTVTALATLVALSTGARPGDVLYGLKRGTEQTQLALAGDSRRGQTLLDLASTRLDELEYLVAEDATALPAAAPADGAPVVLAAGPGTELVLQTLDTMDAQTTDGAAWLAQRSVTTGDTAPLDDLAGWVAGQSAGLSALEDDMPEAARPAFGDSLELLTEIDARADGLRAALDCPAGPATDGSDDLGPVPAPCAPAPVVEENTPGTSPGSSGSAAATPPSGQTAEVPGGTGGSAGGGGSGGSAGGGSTGGAPGTPKPGGGLPTPSVPLPSIDVDVPTVAPTLPSLPLPGSGPTSTVPATGPGVDVCLEPITVGSC